jgi:hypothetical protein
MEISVDRNMTAANNTRYITTNLALVTADATEGGFVREIRMKANPANNTAATVLRVWVNNGSTTGTDTNSVLLTEIGIPATTASATNPQPDFVVPLNVALPAGYKIYLTLGTAPGGSGEFSATAIAGKY